MVITVSEYKRIAASLNDTLQREDPNAYAVLSELGKRIYFDTEGILSQSAEAKKSASTYNATLGTAIENGQPMHLESIQDTMPHYSPREIYEYAPASGKPELREAWRKKMLMENPSLRDKSFGLPVVTNGLTHGLSIAADLFVNDGDSVLIHDKNWEGFELILGVRSKGTVIEYPFFDENGQFNAPALKNAIQSQNSKGKAVILLNFPNNPTGYTPTAPEVERIVTVLRESAEAGMHLVVVIDDAYFGMFFEDGLLNESLFSYLANLHPNILAVKVDGGTKEEYITGFRVGFITYASNSEQALKALEQKTAGIICATIASCSHPSQSILLRAMNSEDHDAQKRSKFLILKGRANRIREVLDSGKYEDAWTPYPFNSGYFMCLRLKTVNARKLRAHLLERHGIGTVALSDVNLRIAFPCIDEQEVEHLYDMIYQSVKELE